MLLIALKPLLWSSAPRSSLRRQRGCARWPDRGVGTDPCHIPHADGGDLRSQAGVVAVAGIHQDHTLRPSGRSRRFDLLKGDLGLGLKNARIRTFCCCTVCIVVVDAQKIDLSGSTNTLPRRYRMSTLDEITKEKQRISEALARVDMQREKLASQLGELEATERVLARYSKGTQLRQSASARTPATATKAAAPARRRGRPPTTTAKAAGGKRRSSNPGDQVRALATGKTQQETAAACKGARPNHAGAALSRHKRAGRIEERDGKLYAIQSTSTEQQAAL